jgi:tRNA 2-thiouridine synthesizing protein E
MEGETMASLLEAIVGAGSETVVDGRFPHAPAGWTRESALTTAQQEGLKLDADHWDAVRALQNYYARHEETAIDLRELHDALDELFHSKGGMKYLYRLFPAGPVAQGCRLAGLKAPAGATDKGFGSVA